MANDSDPITHPAENQDAGEVLLEPRTDVPLDANAGRMVAVPGLGPDRPGGGAAPDGAAARAERQLLTGRAAGAGLAPSLSPTQLAWRQLKKNHLAVAGG